MTPMKKWKLTARRDHTQRVFLTAEALYTWLVDDKGDMGTIGNKMYRHDVYSVQMKKGDWAYIEWMGSEYVYDGDRTDVLKHVSMTVVKPIQNAWLNATVEKIDAWVADPLLDLSIHPARTRDAVIELLIDPSGDHSVTVSDVRDVHPAQGGEISS